MEVMIKTPVIATIGIVELPYKIFDGPAVVGRMWMGKNVGITAEEVWFDDYYRNY